LGGFLGPEETERYGGIVRALAFVLGPQRTALRLWHPLAEQGDPDAQFHLGVMFESGQGVLRSDAEAIKWYREAAEQDDAVAQFNLGVMYAKGVSPNHAEAALWYRRAADHGLAGAQFNLGIMYAEGQGVSQDYAVDARDRVASQNDAAADRRGAGIGI
jgi:uncharacterized protein